MSLSFDLLSILDFYVFYDSLNDACHWIEVQNGGSVSVSVTVQIWTDNYKRDRTLHSLRLVSKLAFIPVYRCLYDEMRA